MKLIDRYAISKIPVVVNTIISFTDLDFNPFSNNDFNNNPKSRKHVKKPIYLNKKGSIAAIAK
tara:strand:- start:140 stop:328 length:189 start_codon:yes stop_codon:yes gene_type:complete